MLHIPLFLWGVQKEAIVVLSKIKQLMGRFCNNYKRCNFYFVSPVSDGFLGAAINGMEMARVLDKFYIWTLL